MSFSISNAWCNYDSFSTFALPVGELIDWNCSQSDLSIACVEHVSGPVLDEHPRPANPIGIELTRADSHARQGGPN